MDLPTIEADVQAVIDHVMNGIKIAQSSDTMQAIEAASPTVRTLVEKVLALAPGIAEAESIAGFLMAAYSLSQVAGIKGEDANVMAEHQAEQGYSND